jgi:hypothetical protein
MRRAVFVVVSVGSIAVCIAAGCTEEYKDCYGDDYVACLCAGGGAGYAKCSPLGDYKTVACVCDGTTPGVDAGTADAEIDAGGDAASCPRKAGSGGGTGDGGGNPCRSGP